MQQSNFNFGEIAGKSATIWSEQVSVWVSLSQKTALANLLVKKLGKRKVNRVGKHGPQDKEAGVEQGKSPTRA